jgi:hypothetical protein
MSANEGSDSHNYVELDDFFGGNQNLRASACPATIRFEFLISPSKLGRQANFDPLPPVKQSQLQGQISVWSGHSLPSLEDKSSDIANVRLSAG